MIKLQKTRIPKILEENAAKWTAELLAVLAKREDPTSAQQRRYNQKDIKDALIRETSGKCAYCESKILHIAFGDIEHIVPKKIQPELSFDWGNLTLACDKCNTYKGKKEGLLDPYLDNLLEHILFSGTMFYAKADSELAASTQAALKLNRTDLLERRADKLQALALQIRDIRRTKDDAAKANLLAALIDDLSSGQTEYSACCSSFVDDLRAKGELE